MLRHNSGSSEKTVVTQVEKKNRIFIVFQLINVVFQLINVIVFQFMLTFIDKRKY